MNDKDGIKDILDLCRLNLMEENVKYSLLSDRDATMKIIDFKKRSLVTKIINNSPTVAVEPEI